MNKMKKLIIVVTSLIAMIVILVGCSNEKNKQTNQDNGVLKSGTMWKEEVGGLVYNLKIIDEIPGNTLRVYDIEILYK